MRKMIVGVWADPCARFAQIRDLLPEDVVPLPLDQGAFTVTDAG